MQELIKIEQVVIDAIETNAVNARELHKALEISKDFSDWVKTQINRAGLRKDVDYIVTSEKVVAGVGTSTRKDYIITTDASKHIAMMSQGQKAKEVRDYFIAVEKEYKLQTSQSSNAMMPMFMEFMSAQQKQNEMMMESMKLLAALVTDMRDTQTAQLKQIVKPQERQNTTISARQMEKINNAIRKSAVSVARYHKLNIPTATRVLYGELNGRMGVSTYYQILEKDFLSAMLFVKSAGEKAKLASENINNMLADEACKIMDELEDDSFYDEPADEE